MPHMGPTENYNNCGTCFANSLMLPADLKKIAVIRKSQAEIINDARMEAYFEKYVINHIVPKAPAKRAQVKRKMQIAYRRNN